MSKMKRWIASALTFCMLLSFVLVGTAIPASAATIAPKPANGTTQDQPFEAGTGGSTYFRIPALVTTESGRVVAGIDARWSGTGDACGIDTMISYSDDNGDNWTYTYANYLGDNNLSYIKNAATFIDPAIAVDGETLYMVVDLYVANYAINTADYRPLTGDPFTAEGYLKLKASGSSSYDHYLKDGKIYDPSNTEVAGYTVDGYFNLYHNGTLESNLFYADTAYQAYATTFLYLTKSTDGGETWGEPKLLDVKDDSEYFYGICPGRGLVTESGRIIFLAYSFPTQYASLIFSDDGGKTWTRSENVTTTFWSSETQVVELDDGTIRAFYRDGHTYLSYTDMIWNESAQNYVRDPNATEVATPAAKNGNNGCMLSAYKYSKPIDGKDAIFVATPATGGSRSDGRIYVFLVDDDNSMELTYAYDITPGTEYYAYSCLTELDNGDLGLLWESGGAALTYSVIPVEDIVARENNVNLTFKDVALDKGESVSYTDTTGDYSGEALTGLDTDIAEVTMTGRTEVTNSVRTLGTGTAVNTEDCLFTFTASGNNYVISRDLGDGTTVYLNHFGTTSNNIPLTTSSNTVAISAGANAGMFKLVSQVAAGGSGSARTLHFHMESNTPYWNRCGNDTSVKCQEYLFRPANADEDTSASPIPGYVQLTAVSQITDGGEYLIAAKNDAGNWYVLNPTTSGNQLEYVAQVVGQTSVSSTEITITGTGHGTTEVQIGNVVYKIAVTEVLTKDVALEVGKSVTFSDDRGYYVGADTSDLDESVATVVVSGTVISSEKALSQPVTSLVSGKQYLIVNTRANKPMTNKNASAAAAAGAGSGLALSGSKEDMAEAAVWTITSVAGGYTVQDQNGKYLTIGSGSAGVGDDAAQLTLTYGGATWTVSQSGAYLNDFGGNGTCAAGWKDGSAASDVGSQWNIYEIVDVVTEGTTQVTFTGVKAGETSVRIGDTVYNITVDGNATDYNEVEVTVGVGQTKTILDKTGDHSDEVDKSGLDETVATVTVTGNTVAGAQSLTNAVTAIESGKTYVIYNKVAQKLMSNAWADASVGGGGTNGLALSSAKDSFQAADIWTITAANGGYYVQDANGKYLTVARGSAGLSDSPVVASLAYDGTDWTVGVNGEYLNDFGGAHTAVAGWSDIDDVNSQWEIYEVVTSADTYTTTIAITGVKEGETSFRIGDTVYEIVVTEEANDGHNYDNGFCVDEGCGAYQPAVLKNGVYEISNGGQLYWFAALVNGDTDAVPDIVQNADADAVLTCDIVVNDAVLNNGALTTNTAGLRSWTPIGRFIKYNNFVTYTGTFDGAGYSISGLYASNAAGERIALFGVAGGGAVVRDLGLKDTYFSGKQYVAGIVAEGYSSSADAPVIIAECWTENAIIDADIYYAGGIAGHVLRFAEITDCHNAATVMGGSTVGGIIGYSGDGTNVIGCSNEGTISGAAAVGGIAGINNSGNFTKELSRCSNTGAVSGASEVGGVVGQNSSTVEDCYNQGNVTGTGSNVGGVVGYNMNSGAKVKDCYNTDDVAAPVIGGSSNTVENAVENCFYLADRELDEIAGTTAENAEVFASGEITWRLNYRTDEGELVWFQTIGEDAYPVFEGDVVHEGSAHEHVFDRKVATEEYLAAEADCENAATYYFSCECGLKGEATFAHGEALGHDWTDADCDTPKTCDRCGETEGEALGHDWTDADCDTPKTCDRCGETEGEALGHDFVDGVCTRCGEDDPDYVAPKLDAVLRLAGANRYATAIMAADEMKAALNVEKFDAIIIASGNDFADALAGSYLATVKNAPILLSYGGTSEKYAYLDTDNIDYVKANLAEGGTVYILGGKNAVPELYEAGLEGYDVKRLGGANRFETNILILKEAGITAGSEVLVCTSNNFADSLSASATGLPILLVWNERGILYGNQPEFLAELEEKNCKFTILGGESAVSAKLEDTIKTYGDVTRLAGKNRMETSVLVAQKYFDAPETAVVAYAWNYPDGLCGGSLAYALKAPLILTMPKYESAAVEYAAENDITTGFVLGGDGLVTDEIVRAIFAMDAEDEIIVK